MGKKSGMRKQVGRGGKKGRSISSVKRTNIKRNKLVKAGKMKPPGSKPRFVEGGHLRDKTKLKTVTKLDAEEEEQKRRLEAEENKKMEEEMYTDMVNMVDPEDLEFLKKRVKFDPDNELFKQVGRKTKQRLANGGVEENYESDANLKRRRLQNVGANMRDLLPIRTKQGWVKQSVVMEEKEEDVTKEDSEEGDDDDDDVAAEDESTDLSEKEFSVVELMAKRREFVNEKKLQIGSMASNFLEDPNDRMNVLERLVKMVSLDTASHDVAVAFACNTTFKLATLTVCEILKDVTPNYKILNVNTKTDTKLKKETLKLQKYEQSILSCTKNYLVRLEKQLAAGSNDVRSKELSLSCMCELLVAHPQFNFAENVVNFVVPFLNSRIKELRMTVLKGLQTVLRNDKRGEISFAIVRKINHVLKSKKRDRLKPDMLQVMLGVKLHALNEAHEQKEEEAVALKQRKKPRKKDAEIRLSKKERKRQKANEKLENELLEAKGEESKKTRLKFATDITNLLFAIYFRLLKTLAVPEERGRMSGSDFRKLLRPLFIGLGKFGHLMSVSYFQDLLRTISHLLTTENRKLGKIEVLLCVRTVFAILGGQGDQLTIDPASFYKHINQITIDLDLVDELNLDPNCKSPQAILSDLLRDAFILRRKKVGKNHLVDIWKRVVLCVLVSSPSGVASLVAFLKESSNTNPSLWSNCFTVDEDVEVGSYSVSCASAGKDLALVPKNQSGNEVERRHLNNCILNGNSLLWELSSLVHHFDPSVSQSVSKLIKGGSSSGKETAKERSLMQPSSLKDLEGNVSECGRMIELTSDTNIIDFAILSSRLPKMQDRRFKKRRR